MADTILGTDITVYYLDENRQKRLEWTGALTGSRTINEVYSAMGTLLDEATQGDDATAFKADTPVEYTIGILDANDKDPWYISYECMQHLTGGSLKTSGWTHADGTAVGIIVVPVNTNTILTASLGLNISGATTGNGTLLEIIEQGAVDFLVIRPDTNAAGDNFTTNAQVITCNATTASQDSAGSNTGEQIWANLYNVTPIDADTHVYMYQGLVSDATRARIADINDATLDWWDEGAFDRCIFTNDYQSATFAVIDAGNISVFARKGNTLFDSFEVVTSLISGGRNPVPLKASSDGNNTTGHKAITVSGGSGVFSVGDEISGDVSGARGIITLIVNPGATATYHYYPIGDPQVAFNGTEAITNVDDTGAATGSGAVSNQGPALATWFTNNAAPSVAYGFQTFDIDDDATAEGWGYDIDCNSNPLTEVYEWGKFICFNGGVTTGNTDGVEGEQYVGPTVYLSYSGAVTGLITEGNDVTQETSGATGIVVSHDTTLKQILLRDTRGTFATAAALETLTDNVTAGTVEIDTLAEAFNAYTDAPLGRLAGGRWFGARGGLLSNWLGADENDFELIDSAGVKRTRPIAISLSVSNLVGAAETEVDSDLVWMHRLLGAGLAINKVEYSAAGGEAVGAATLVVDAAITADTPGKTTGGVLNLRDASASNAHYRIRFDSWSVSTFTLSNIVIASADASTNTTTIVEAGAFGAAKRGDIVVNHTRGEAVSYVTSVDSANQVTISPAIALQAPTDSIELNCIPITLVDTLDDVYVSLIDQYATGPSASVSLVYVAPMFYRVKVANTRNATKIQRFVTDDTTSGTDRNVATIRNEDTIHV